MRTRLALLLIAALSVASCAHNVARMSRNYVGGHPVGGVLALNIERTNKGDSASYELFLHWHSTFQIDVRQGPSLTITADHERMTFSVAKNELIHDMWCDKGPCAYDDRA